MQVYIKLPPTYTVFIVISNLQGFSALFGTSTYRTKMALGFTCNYNHVLIDTIPKFYLNLQRNLSINMSNMIRK